MLQPLHGSTRYEVMLKQSMTGDVGVADAPILVVSASAGTGHVRAGDALAAALRNAGCDAEHVDVLDLAPRWVRRFYGGGFELLAKRAPGVWRRIYERADGDIHDSSRLGDLAARILFREFRRLYESRPWRACVCTHFLPPQLAAARTRIPFALVMTDFAIHRYWVQPAVREYFVPSREVASELRRRLPEVNVSATGIPLSAEFSGPPYWVDARRSYGLATDGPVVLVTGGGLGLGVDNAVRAALHASVPGLEVIAVCGRDEDARRRLDVLAERESRLHVHGFTHDMPTLMSSADLVVTKPGGLTTSEALALGRPMLLTRPVPGHEAGNAAFLVRQRAALTADGHDALVNAMTRFFSEPGLRVELANGARRIGRPTAAADIAAALRRHHIARHVA